MDFQNLTKSIIELDTQLTNKTKQTINICVTIRNWLFGYYIQEYELDGSDRATYGERLLEKLAEELQKNQIASSTYRSLKLYKQVYQKTYSQSSLLAIL